MLQMCGPTGIGFLYGKSDLLFTMPPFLGMVLSFYCKEFRIGRLSVFDFSSQF